MTARKRRVPRATSKQLASLLGIPEREVRALVRRGVIPRQYDGGHDVGAAVRRYVAHLRAGPLQTNQTQAPDSGRKPGTVRVH